jgi:hypothetical protein
VAFTSAQSSLSAVHSPTFALFIQEEKMYKKPSFQNILIVMLLALLANNGKAIAKEDTHPLATRSKQAQLPAATEPTPVPGGLGFISMPGLSFISVNSTDPCEYELTFLFNPGTSSTACYAPVILPNGATITKLVLYYYDFVSATVTVHLQRVYLGGTNTLEDLASVSSVGEAGGGVSTTTVINNSLVDQQSYFYIVSANFEEGSLLTM